MEQSLLSIQSRIETRIEESCQRAGRNREELTLIAVSKFHPLESILALRELGQLAFGESRVQELEQKNQHLAQDISQERPINWHFIGQLQKNKVRKVLQITPWIHSVDSLELAQRISRIAGQEALTARIFLQVLLSPEEKKRGFSPSLLQEQFAQLASLPHLQLEGLMCIPPPVENPQDQRPQFQAMRALAQEIQNQHNHPLPGLSMGMSSDFEIAIEEGATHLRLGTILFGQRKS